MGQLDSRPPAVVGRVLVVLPTYNERDTLESISQAVLEALPHCRLWIVDDNSPDGTGAVADLIARRSSRVEVFHRDRKRGLGTAYAESFQRALERGYDYVIEMDADFSHDPKVLPELIEASSSADLVLGSRYVPGGSTPDWTLPRRVISRVGNIVARTVLSLPIHDATTGYRVFSRRALATLRLDRVKLQGYGFQIETACQIQRAGLRVKEYPITFIDRRQGQSKMSRAIVLEALVYVFRRRIVELMGRLPLQQPDSIRHYDDPPEDTYDGNDGVQPAAPALSQSPVYDPERAKTYVADQSEQSNEPDPAGVLDDK